MIRRFSTFKFTPVDILVVAFICMFLIIIIQPACRKSRIESYQITCANNLSSIGKAMQVYTNDNDGKYPRAGGPTSKWSTQIADYRALNRNLAFQIGSDGSGGYVTISSSLYLLIKHAGLSPKTFVCPGDYGVTVFNPADYGVHDKTPADLWDFGPHINTEDNPSNHCSYAYHMPYGQYALTTSSDPGMAVAADRNPWMSISAENAKDFGQFNPDGDRDAVKAGNAFAHDNEGQNVLFVDGHVNFEKTPCCGPNKDNIYTICENGDTQIGRVPEVFFSEPANKMDSMLVNDSQVYKETTTKQVNTLNSIDLNKTSIVATLDCPIPEHKNVIWCSTFQMAWDKLKDDIIGEPIQILGAEELAARLNQVDFSPSNLEEESYYATAGFVAKGIIEQIHTEMKKRFPAEPAPVFLERYKTLPAPILAYSFLSIDVGFEHPFYTYRSAFDFKDSNETKTGVTAFCDQSSDADRDLKQVCEQVDIIYYEYSKQKGSDWFAVDLCKHTQSYQIILALVPRSDTLGEAVSGVEEKITEFKHDPDYKTLRKLRPIDRLIVPDVLYKLTHHFSELENMVIGNQPWHDQGYYILEAMQMINFSLSRTGVVVKSMSFIGVPAGRFGPRRIEEPRYFYFNRPFLIYVKKRGDDYSPIFAMWVDNAELMNPFQDN